MFILVTVIGLLSGVCAFLLKRMVAFVSTHLTSGLEAFGANWQLAVLPLVGLVATGLLTRYLFRAKLSNGVRHLKEQLKAKNYYIAPLRMIESMLASTVTLGFGGSAGSEGPIACTGAAIGGNFGRWCRLSPNMMMLMIGCGAGAGIAGIFKSPLGGALFTLEVLRIPMTTVAVLALIVCTIVAGMTAYALGGFTMDVTVADGFSGFEPSLIPIMIGFGLVCGVYSLYYSYIVKIVEQLLNRLHRPLVRNIVAGVALSAMIYLFPALYGEGYGVIGDILNGHYGAIISDGMFALDAGAVKLLILVAGGIVVLKCFATSATNNGGGVSGEFAPSLFAGSMLGFLFAMGINALTGSQLNVGVFALCGMAGVMSGAIRAPLMAIMLTTEMVGAYNMFLPILIVSAVSFGIVRLVTFDDFYSRHVDRPNGLASRLNNH